ncbi:succinate dehydrogenase subunit C [Sphingomonas gellani]|uniref:Succinate dehydrogenase cytochrome b556 subunit n=1 Tax=Sphingomonas gellani TaxID=1166340 RepID=A0A1H8BD19_9SPHN|nr:succinate dehydrogenase, cytochrome b556 subunit [Sphingomonas gellani]SEM80349.1 succinate dehydrogenase subunit C [Sphingomonas gellani]
MASRTPARPISPHIQVYKWGPHMLVSILHRATGGVLSTVGSVLLVWFLAALAGGEGSYATFRDVFTHDDGRLNVIGYVVGIGITLALFQHMASGVRHLVLDTGAGFELKRNKTGALATLLFSVVATAAFWLYLGMK